MSRWFPLPVPWPMAIAMFLTIWWTLLFAVLPFGVRSQHEAAEIVRGTDPGAPVAPRLVVKAIATTGISIIAFIALMWLIQVTG